MEEMEDILAPWDGEEIVIRRDQETGAWIVIAIHSTRLGPATGGTRMRRYPGLRAAVEDALRLSAGMTRKFAVAGFPRGGGKAVIALSRDLDPPERDTLLRRYGALIADLRGLYQTGPDVGTTSRDMDVIAERGAPHVHSRTEAAGGAGDSSEPTAAGVVAGIEVVCEELGIRLGDSRVVVQGAGSVGRRVIAALRAAGVDVVWSETDPALIDRLTDGLGYGPVPVEGVYDIPCDIFAPCALGGVLNAETIPRLRCRAVAGAANNQLATEEDAERLQNRNILYAPDFVVNMGGAVGITGMEAFGWSRDEAAARVVRMVQEALREIFAAGRQGIAPLDAADRIVMRALSTRAGLPPQAEARRPGS